MADDNGDRLITLLEIEHFLQDRVSKEVAPLSQIPLAVGDKKLVVGNVDGGLLVSVKQGSEIPLTHFSGVEQRGLVQDALANADTTIVWLFHAFRNALKEKRLLEPAGNCADEYYNRLVQEESIKPLHNYLRRNFAAALMDEGQQVMNKLLKTDPQVVSDIESRPFVFDHLPAQLARATELLGNKHFLYNTLKAKELFMEGLTAFMKDSSGVISGERLHLVSDKMEAALQFDSTAAFVYSYLCLFYIWDYPNREKSINFAKRSVELSPNWVIAQVNAGYSFGLFGRREGDDSLIQKAEQHLLKALELDSTYLITYQALSNHYWAIRPPDMERYQYFRDKFIQSTQRFLESNQEGTYALYWLNLGIELRKANRIEEAMIALEQCEKLTHQKLNAVFQFLGAIYLELGLNENALRVAKRQIELNPYNPEGYSQLSQACRSLKLPHLIVQYLEPGIPQVMKSELASIGVVLLRAFLAKAYQEVKQPQKAIETLDESFSGFENNISENPFALLGWLLLAETYHELGRQEKAKIILEKIIELFPDPANTLEMFIVSRSYLGLGDLEAMQITIDEGLKKFPGDVGIYYQAGCLYSLAKQEEKSLEWLEKALQKGLTVSRP